MATAVFTATFEDCTCCVCGITFYVPDNWNRERRERHDSFYCPNGHSQHYPSKTDAEKLREQLAREKHRNEQSEAMLRDQRDRARDETGRQRRFTAAARGQVTKIKNRVKNGVCPCCNRSFTNLRRHMTSQHPDWTPEAVADEAAQ